MRVKVRNFAPVCLQVSTADNRSPRAETRQDLVVHSSRWAGRSPSQQLRRKVWTPPDLEQEPLPSNTFRIIRTRTMLSETLPTIG